MLQLKIALRYLFSRKTHSAVNVISLISVVGVAVATMAIVIVLSVFNGFERLAFDQLSQLDPPLRVVPVAGKVITNADSAASAIFNYDRRLTVVPTIGDQALAMIGERQIPVNILGVDNRWLQASHIENSIIDGQALIDYEGFNTAIISVGAAVNLQTHPDETYSLRVYTPRRVGRVNIANPATAFRADSALVAGVFQTGHQRHDENLVILPAVMARELLDYDTEATSIEVWGVNDRDLTATAAELKRILGPSYRVLDRISQEGSSFAMIAIEKWITFAMLAFILLIASFNIISTLCLLVLEKEGNMGIMLAMGATPANVGRIFVYEGWLVSTAGGIIGLVLGVALTLAQQWGQFIKLNGDPSRLIITAYPVELRPLDLLLVMALVAFVGFFTSLITTTFARRRYR